MSESNQLAVAAPAKASDQLATFLGIEKGMMLETLKAQCFKGRRPDEVSDTQLAAFVSTANVLQVNPLVPGMLYAYPERNGGITPILGPDGVFKKLDEFIASGKLTGFECEVKMGADGKPESAEAIIHRAEGQKPARYTAYFSEWAVTSNPNWAARPRHMLWTRAIKQAARQVIHGLPMDADEYEIAQMQNVTPPGAAPQPPRPEPPKRQKKGAAAVKENVQEAEVVTEKEATTVTGTVDVAPPDSHPDLEAAKEVVKPAESPKPVEPEKSEPVQEAAAPSSAPQKRAFIKEGETVEVRITVKEVAPLNIMKDGKPEPSIQAKVDGGFFGTVYHRNGGKMVDGKPVVPEHWQAGRLLNVTLLGVMNRKVKNEDGQLGKLQVFVQSVQPLGDEAAMEV